MSLLRIQIVSTYAKEEKEKMKVYNVKLFCVLFLLYIFTDHRKFSHAVLYRLVAVFVADITDII